MEELASIMDVGLGSVFRLIHAMGANKAASRWVLYNLTENQLVRLANIAWTHYDNWTDDNSMLDRIIAIDETWLRSYDPQDDYASHRWVFPGKDP